jgi:hypothetical protein
VGHPFADRREKGAKKNVWGQNKFYPTNHTHIFMQSKLSSESPQNDASYELKPK